MRRPKIDALAEQLGPAYGPMIVFAAATGLRPGEWIALEHRDIDRDSRIAYLRRAFVHGQLKSPKTLRSTRAVPLQSIALEALDRLPARKETPLVSPAPRGGYLDLHNFSRRTWKAAQLAAEIHPLRRANTRVRVGPRASGSRSRGASSSCTAPGSGSRARRVAGAASSSRCRSRSRAAMAGERVLDTVQIHP